MEEKEIRQPLKNQMLFIAGLSALCSQIYMKGFVENFNISFGIIILVIFFYKGQVEEKMATGFMCATFVYIIRVIMYFIGSYPSISAFQKGAINYFPEFIFYVVYVIMYMVMCNKKISVNTLCFRLMICDFAANITEIGIRYRFYNEVINGDIIIALAMVAILRSALIWIIINALDRYNIKLLKKEHRDRYINLLMSTSKLKGEAYLMEKTMDNIEVVMSKSYGLYSKMSVDEPHKELAQEAVSIARDIHEIKKELALTMRGISELAETDFKDTHMEFYDLIDILQEVLSSEIKEKAIKLNIIKGENFNTAHDYYLISILRNLVNNAIDAIDNTEGVIDIIHSMKSINENRFHEFKVKDNGVGIDKEDIELIFNAGFSTKIDFNTGNINRGLGLSLVKDIIENKFHGEIQVRSEKEKGTEFIVLIPVESMGGTYD